MRRFISIIFVVLLLFPAFPLLLPVRSVAAQDVQPSQSSDTPISTSETRVPLSIPYGTVVEIEAPYRLSSKDFKPKDTISFRVVNPVKVNGVTLVEQGATATGRIEKAKRGGHFGRAGLFVWTMHTQ